MSGPVPPDAAGSAGWLAGRMPGAAVAAAVVTTSLLAAVALAVPVPLAGTLAVGSCIAAASARPRAVLAVGGYAAALVLLLSVVEPRGPWGTVVTDLVAVALVAGISAALASHRTALERATAATARRHAELAAVVDSCADGIIGMSVDGTVTSWNAGAERMTGRCAALAIGTPLVDVVGEDARGPVTAALATIRRGDPAPHYEASRVRADGSMLHVSVAWSPVHGPDGRLTGISAVFRDVVDRETERRALEDRVRQYERLESLGTLVGGVAHDFNNLLAVVLTHTEFVEDATRGDPSVQRDLGAIRGAAERAADLTRQLLTFARGGSPDRKVLSLDEVLRRAVPLLSRTLGPRVRLVVRGCPESTAVRADAGRLEQVVVDLAVNARDAMPDGGTLTIDTSVVRLDPGHAGITPPPAGGDHVRLRVSDTGTGMAPEVAAHVFEPFFTTKHEASGTGLGLATVWGIVTDLGGSVGVRSETGTGTVFTLYLPRVASDTGPDAVPTTPPPAEPPVHRGSVLVVEDEDPLRDLVVRVLRQSGYDVAAAANGADALGLAGDRQFDLLLTDVVLPGMSGPDVAEAVRALQPGIPVLYTSGYTRGAFGADRSPGDGVDLLPKPFTRAGLVDRVSAALDHTPA